MPASTVADLPHLGVQAQSAREGSFSNMDIATIEQINTWLRRFRTDGRRFDFVQGLATGLVCALPVIGDLDDTLALLPLVDDPAAFAPPAGIDRNEVVEVMASLFASIEDDLDDGTFRPYMGGRYVNRIKPETPCADWCGGFSIAALFLTTDLREDENLSMHFIPVLLLAGLSESDVFLPESTPAEKQETEELARKELIPSIFSIYTCLHEPEGDDTE